eukprot:TRINITY_DN4526_c0_g1_i1.p1 TRINITY_DN4526_c0_g1~~TRINITY_DN4526_c0_g1_i1.p1  ORF type:complete len:134 (-),score=24.58 TRINITY_DN4526_c0_g1_i1:94-495(-)
MQSLYYLALGLLLIFFDALVKQEASLDQIFVSSRTNTISLWGWTTILAFCGAAVCSAFSLKYVVTRAKKCLDFGCTQFILHLAACCWYSGFPATWTWWLVQFVCVVTTVILGEWLCFRAETAEVPLSPGQFFV